MAAELNFDATNIAPSTGYETVPAGWYNVAMDESEMKPTKDGAGTFLEARFDILDGQYKGRKLFSRMNLRNPSAQAMEIAQKELSAIAHAVGILVVQNSAMLHGHPLKVKVKIRKGDDQYEDQNQIISYKNINEQVDAGSAAAKAAPASGFTPPPAAAAPAFVPPPAAAPSGPQRPTDPTHIHAAGTPAEQWWVNGAWTPAVVQAPPAPPPAPAPAPAPAQQTWTPPAPAATQPWVAPAAAPAPAPAPAPLAIPPAPAPAPAVPPAPAGADAASTVVPPWAAPPAPAA